MLIEARIENFRSLRNEQQFSLVRGPGKERVDANSFTPELGEGVKSLPLLRSAAIYGPNAGGKSNLLKGLAVMQRIVMTSASSQLGDLLPVVPFLFDRKTAASPTLFEVTLIAEKARYQYGFTATRERVHEEWLYAYPKGRLQRWFNREDETYRFGDSFRGERDLWSRSTRPNALFLSTAMQLNSEQLRPLFAWFADKLRFAGVGGWSPANTARMCEGGGQGKEEVLRFLRAADFSIQDVQVKRAPFDPERLPEGTPSQLRDFLEYQLKDQEGLELMTSHKTRQGGVVHLPFNDESDGTQKMFSFAGPWIETLKLGRVLFMDELHDNLHPALVRFLVGLFHDTRTNPNNAQLVFTTHETSILSQELFRRDQIWFCERDAEQATSLYPLTDFSPRKGLENLERGYLSGRYGAVPYVRPLSGNGVFGG